MSSFEPDPRVQPQAGFRADTPLQDKRRFRADRDESSGTEPLPGSEPDGAQEAPDLDELLARSYEEGRAAGRAELPWSQAEALTAATQACERGAALLEQSGRAYLRANRGMVVDLAVAISEHILRRTLSSDASELVALVERAIAHGDQDESVRVMLSPGDLETLREGLAEDLDRMQRERDLTFGADPALAPGDVRTETGSLEVDARLESMLSFIRRELELAIAGTGEQT